MPTGKNKKRTEQLIKQLTKQKRKEKKEKRKEKGLRIKQQKVLKRLMLKNKGEILEGLQHMPLSNHFLNHRLKKMN